MKCVRRCSFRWVVMEVSLSISEQQTLGGGSGGKKKPWRLRFQRLFPFSFYSSFDSRVGKVAGKPWRALLAWTAGGGCPHMRHLARTDSRGGCPHIAGFRFPAPPAASLPS